MKLLAVLGWVIHVHVPTKVAQTTLPSQRDGLGELNPLFEEIDSEVHCLYTESPVVVRSACPAENKFRSEMYKSMHTVNR